MAPLSTVFGPALLAAALLSSSARAASTPLAPSDAAARRHAFGIFNAVHSAMRQWGSSLNHNGVSLFLATVPEGQLFYHGGMELNRPEGFEWLAFELEHAQMFGTSRPDGNDDPVPGGGGGPPKDKAPETAAAADLGVWDWHVWDRHRASQIQKRSLDSETQKAIGADADAETEAGPGDDNDEPGRGGRPDFWSPGRGYFHTYRANRPLNLLYLDGMAAGKSPFGCLDTQDLLLLDRDPDLNNGSWWRGSGSELVRAQGLCDLAKDWAWEGGQIDGFIRTEAGFEIIYCDFSDGGGLDLASVQTSPYVNETGGMPVFSQFEFLRGVSQRYHGQPEGRIHVDWSSMVSAFFYDVNLTNPDASRPELPRLAQVTRDERHSIRSRIQEVATTRHVGSDHPLKDKAVVNWQGIVDTIVTRFSDRFSQMANDTSVPISQVARDILPLLVYPYINYSDPTEAAEVRMDRCTNHYMTGALATESSWTPEDRSIYTAVTEVTRTICTSLFDMRAVLYDEAANKAVREDDETPNSIDSRVREILDELMNTLQWTTWRQCSPCLKPDELCLIAMFPWGTPEDHFNPRCKNNTEANLSMRNNYWMMGR
ncbi:hypothetical protein F503_07134 [Ophiostoma piceae UAMH 11346]|uniref:Uncharacterized protein n=1 Tax=Ophiostoma piceae (strain UAMH 11346) TaxID=1262450 RepID=S3CRV0_OPHP1|nr:hypothetical protein F503_07134 [Ophiostoma piceae UAMH 11346]